MHSVLARPHMLWRQTGAGIDAGQKIQKENPVCVCRLTYMEAYKEGG